MESKQFVIRKKSRIRGFVYLAGQDIWTRNKRYALLFGEQEARLVKSADQKWEMELSE